VDGESALLTALRARLDAMGVELVDGGVPSEVRSEPGGAELHFADGDVRLFDRIALTGPCPSVAALCPQLTADEHARLARVAYQGVICVSLLVRHPLAGYYVTHVSDPTVPFDAMIEATALGGAERFDGHALVYLPRYLAPADPLWARSDGDIRRDFVAALERMHPKFRAAHVVATRVARVRALHAIPTLDYSRAALPSATTSLRNVFVVNAAQVAGGMARLNEAVAIANARAGLLASDLRASARLLAVVP
jgi:protoporphyrinogen oxidase